MFVQPKDHYFCPITHQLYKDPVIAEDGRTYERFAIENWFKIRQTSPLTNQEIGTKLIPNYDKKSQIASFYDKYNICSLEKFLITIKFGNVTDFESLKIVQTHLNSITLTSENGIEKNETLLELFDSSGGMTTALCTAAQFGHLTIGEKLVSLKCDVNESNGFKKTPLHLASQFGHYDFCVMLIKNGANVNCLDLHNATPLLLSCEQLNIRVADLLIESGTDVNICTTEKNYPLHIAIQRHLDVLVPQLILKNADINVVDSSGKCALTIACEKGNLSLVQFFLKVNCKQIVNYLGKTPFFYAVRSGKFEIVKAFIENKVEINHQSADGTAPIHEFFLLRTNPDIEILKLLLKSNADPNIKTNNGNTPLHFAVMDTAFNENAVEILIQSGATILQNTDNLTPIDIANQVNAKNIVNCINRCLLEYRLQCERMPKTIRDLQDRIEFLNDQITLLSKSFVDFKTRIESNESVENVYKIVSDRIKADLVVAAPMASSSDTTPPSNVQNTEPPTTTEVSNDVKN